MPRRKNARNAALDGLRSIAILCIMLYHLSVPWLPSGHLGVVMFLVLGGYLASSTVLRTMRREGSLSLPRLWLKRVTRIWPPMAVMVAFTVALCALFNHILLTKLRPDLIPSLLLANNLGAILRGASYFDNLGGTSPLMHLWYLGVDIQFFLVWTALASFLCPNGRSSRVARRCALALALVSAILMAVLYDPNADPTRVYYGPDTRAFAPLLGAWLGLAWPLGGRPVRLDAARHTVRTLPLALVSPLALAGLVVMMVLTPDTAPFLYRGGMALAAVLTVLVLAGALDRRTPLARVLSLRPLAWLGTRSFGLYLWHFPLFQLFRVTNNDTSPLMVVLAIALSFVLAELSVRLVEIPIARGKLPLIASHELAAQEGRERYLAFIPAFLTFAALAVGITGLIVTPDETAVPDGAIQSTGAGAAEAMDLSDRTNATDSADEEDTTGTEESDKGKKDDEADTANDEQDLNNLPTGSIVLQPSKEDNSDGLYTPVIIADSVAGDTQWYIDDHMPDALLDSYVGRRPDQALAVLDGYLKQGVVGDIVVLDSFSNMPATDEQMEALIEKCGKRNVYLVNVRIPQVEQEQINKILARFAKEYDNVELIDWNSLSEGHPEWLYADGTHLTPEGQPHYVDMISNAIARDYAEGGGMVLPEPEEEEEELEEETNSNDEDASASDDTDDEPSSKTTTARIGSGV